MTPADLPLRLIPRRRPHPLAAAGVMVAALLLTFVIRYFVFGLNMGQGFVSTIFPALMLGTLYAGLAWGVAGWAVVVTFVLVMVDRYSQGGVSPQSLAGLGVFAVSALITVGLAGALREMVIRLDEVRRARDAAEAQRRESEERFRVLADSAAAIMWVTRPGGRREFVNRAYCEFLGAPLEEAVNFDWRERLHPDDLPRVLEEQVRGESGSEPFTLEARYRRADGEWRWLRSISRPRRTPEGELDGFIGIAFDVTETKKVEADLKDINEVLAVKIAAAVAERDQAQAALMQSQKLEALGQLTGGVAHDFNNLLTVVIGALDIILRNPNDEQRRTRLGEAALAAARRGERLTQQLLAFSRRQPLKAEVLAPDALLHESEPLLRRAVGEGFDLRFDLRAPEALALIDGGQLEAAVLNLLLNARDAVEDSGRIDICTEVVKFDAPRDDLPAGDYLKVMVADDGVGMSPETKARAIEPFFTTKPVGKGTGLGLSQVYGFARQSGGTVEIDTEVGRGARISLYLPLTDQPPAAAAPRRSPQADPVLKVLLVEDDVEVGDLIEAMLRELGHDVARAATAEQGLAAASDENIGLVLTDIIMPGGRNGVDLAREISRRRPRLPIVLSSGFTGAALAEADRGPWPLLRKPYTVEALKAVIAAAAES